MKSLASSAWMILFVLWAVHFALSLRDFFPALQDICVCLPGGKTPILSSTGMTWGQFSSMDPRVAGYVESILVDDGIGGVSLSLFGMITSATSYRRGEKWAWYAQWLMPIGILGAQLNIYQLTGAVNVLILGVVFTLMALFALLISFRQFFPRRD